MKKLNRGPAEMAKWLRRHSLHKSVRPETRAKARRSAANLDALASHKAKKVQAAG